MRQGAGKPAAGQPAPRGSERLDSWKEIAAYLKRGVTTVQRWEKHEGLPVHRHLHAKLGSVYAYRPEIDAWWDNNRPRLETEGGRAPADEATNGRSRSGLGERRPGSMRLRQAGVMLGLLVGIPVGGSVWKSSGLREVHSLPLARFELTLAPDLKVALEDQPAVAISADGTRLLFAARHGDRTALFLRHIDGLEATPIPGTDGASGPFFSPDGEWVGFFAHGKLKKVTVGGASLQALSDAPTPRGASWGRDGRIYFSPSTNSGIWSIGADGGSPRVLTRPDRDSGEESHRWPQVLPDGRAVVFTIRTSGSGSYEEASIGVQPLEPAGLERKVVLEGGSFARYVPTGHLIYSRSAALWAVPFDTKRYEATVRPERVLSSVGFHPGSGAAQYALSDLGSIVYVSGNASVADRVLVWVDRDGAARPLTEARRPYLWPRLSPSGREVAFAVEGANSDVWVYDILRASFTRLTFDGGNSFPIWTPDGRRLSFSSNRTGSMNLFVRAADGSGTTEELLESAFWQRAASWSPDGRALGFVQANPASGQDIWLRPGPEAAPVPLLRTRHLDGAPVFSPDGRWLAYVSDQSGRNEVYVMPFGHSVTGKWKISTGGGAEPVWAPSGDEIFYRQGDRMMVVRVRTRPDFEAEKPILLFERSFERSLGPYPNYDVSPDGRRFLMVEQPHGEVEDPRRLLVVLNWFEQLRGRTPGARQE